MLKIWYHEPLHTKIALLYPLRSPRMSLTCGCHRRTSQTPHHNCSCVGTSSRKHTEAQQLFQRLLESVSEAYETSNIPARYGLILNEEGVVRAEAFFETEAEAKAVAPNPQTLLSLQKAAARFANSLSEGTCSDMHIIGGQSMLSCYLVGSTHVLAVCAACHPIVDTTTLDKNVHEAIEAEAGTMPVLSFSE